MRSDFLGNPDSRDNLIPWRRHLRCRHPPREGTQWKNHPSITLRLFQMPLSLVHASHLKPVVLANHPPAFVDNIPAILLTSLEDEQLCKRRENTLIMKFFAGRPKLFQIRDPTAAEWQLETPPTVGVLDVRHVTLHMESAADTNRALARDSNKMNTSMFRLFRWSPDFEVGKESTIVAVWVKFYNLPLHYYNEATLQKLGSLLEKVLRIHPSTPALTNQIFAKVCIEMDITKPFGDTLWIGTSKEYGWKIDVEYIGNNTYCSNCGLLGHTLGLCRRKSQAEGKSVINQGAATNKK